MAYLHCVILSGDQTRTGPTRRPRRILGGAYDRSRAVRARRMNSAAPSGILTAPSVILSAPPVILSVPPVILSEAKNLAYRKTPFGQAQGRLRFAQGDSEGSVRG